LPGPVREKLEHISQAIGQISSDISMISRRLHPTSLEVLGLARSIEIECNNFSRLKEVPVSLELDNNIHSPSPSKEISLSIYRILQEGLRNIIWHARASRVRISLSAENHHLKFRIEDDGIGFDTALSSRHEGLGIASMAERAHLIRGDLVIKSRPGKGTTIELTVPLNSKSEG